MLKDYSLSLEEEDVSGTFNKEVEYVYYARIVDFDELNRADSRAVQEQWEVRVPKTDKNAAGGSIRVRSVKENGGPVEYILTSKVNLNNKGDKLEVSVETTAEQFIQFKFLSERGMKKERFTFNIDETLKWEIDVYFLPDGSYAPYCKIDLEVPGNIKVPEFPIRLEEVISNVNLVKGSPDDIKITEMYDKYFLTKNVFIQ